MVIFPIPYDVGPVQKFRSKNPGHLHDLLTNQQVM